MKKRTTFYFPLEAASRLHSIMKRSRLENRADVIRAALGAYDELLEVSAAQCRIVVRDKHGEEYAYSPHSPFHYPGYASGHAEKSAEQTEDAPKNFVFSAEAAAKLDSIRLRSRLQSNADVIRAALGSFDELISVVAVGDQIIIRDRFGNEQFYSPFAPLVRSGLDLDSDAVRIAGTAGKAATRQETAEAAEVVSQ